MSDWNVTKALLTKTLTEQKKSHPGSLPCLGREGGGSGQVSDFAAMETSLHRRGLFVLFDPKPFNF